PQNWNPYSYVLNNPLNLTDPSGYSFLSKYWRTIAAIVVTVYTGGAASGAAWGWAAGLTGTSAAIAGGFVAGAIQTNSLRGGIYGAFSAGIFNKIGIAYQGATGVKAAQGVLAHAAAGGVMSSLQGGKFGHGFASAGFTQALSPGIGKLEGPIRQGTAVAVLGGTTSVMTGGKFGNGAVTAAFSYAFGRAASGAGSGNVNDTSPSPPPVIESGGDVTILEEALGMLPPDVLAELNRAGISYVAVGESVTEYLTHLRGVAPRGWGSGATWDSVPGGFDANTKSVIVATRGAHSHGSVNMALHEIGHAYDFSTGYPSRSTEFHISYGVDRRNLRSYYLQPGMAGRSEAFAESFAGYFSRNQEYMNRHPALTNYWSSRRRP
ncbi:anthrax toxin lethal factor-related metalloendopeptidase, partial [Denitratimonas tolerans]